MADGKLRNLKRWIADGVTRLRAEYFSAQEDGEKLFSLEFLK
jgi:hypothetical protein